MIGLVSAALQSFVNGCNDTNREAWGGRERPYFLNLGAIHGGVWPGSVPAECIIEGQFGFPPPGACEEAKSRLSEALSAVARDPGWPLTQPPAIEFVGVETPPEIGERLQRLIAGSRLYVLRGFDHWSVLTDGRHQLTHRLAEFVEGRA